MEDKHELERADQNTELEHGLKRRENSWVRTHPNTNAIGKNIFYLRKHGFAKLDWETSSCVLTVGPSQTKTMLTKNPKITK